MTVRSMTGFARVDGGVAGDRWTWEAKSVNGRGLDLRFRLPSGFEHLEPMLRERIGRRLVRGSCSFALTLERGNPAMRLRVNEEALEAVLAAMDVIRARVPGAAPPSLEGILAFRGVVDAVEDDCDEAEAGTRDASVLTDFAHALDELVQARAREGAALGTVLGAHVASIERLVAAAEASPARTPEAVRARLQEQIRQLTGAGPELDSARLHQEAVLIATRADIREEIDRLRAHTVEARKLLSEGGAVGRKLDFLAQEFNRETNTLCSKSNDRDLTAIGLELKVAVDQLREQTQNVE